MAEVRLSVGYKAEDYGLLTMRLRTLLPEEYQESFENVKPVSMGSAGLKYDEDGLVAWDEIWQSFCDLAMAGGPPHRGRLLEPGTRAEIALDPERYEAVCAELCRGVEMVSGLVAEPSGFRGWIDVECPSRAMAGWLARAINIENVSAHVDGMMLHLPAGPQYRVEKEIKNVVVSIAKTCHYWVGHTSVAQHRAIADLLKEMDGEAPLLQPPFPEADTREWNAVRERMMVKFADRTGLQVSGQAYAGWIGVECGSVQGAVWMMRMIVACNVLARREESALYVPVTSHEDDVVWAVARVYSMARAQGVL